MELDSGLQQACEIPQIGAALGGAVSGVCEWLEDPRPGKQERMKRSL